MTAQRMWECFCQSGGVPPETPYEAWSFGGAPDQLAKLVCKGIKTATASGYDLYALDEEEPMPAAGDYSVILNSRDEPACVICTTRTYTVPFCNVSAEHAFREGEGDRSLAYWRQVHWDFFTQEYMQYGLTFSEDSPVVCEEFELVFRLEDIKNETEE